MYMHVYLSVCIKFQVQTISTLDQLAVRWPPSVSAPGLVSTLLCFLRLEPSDFYLSRKTNFSVDRQAGYLTYKHESGTPLEIQQLRL